MRQTSNLMVGMCTCEETLVVSLSDETYPHFSLQTEMKLVGVDTEALRQHFGKKMMELEEEKRKVQVKLDIF